jgi:hypothetical protein
MNKNKEIIAELKSVISGKTMDAVVPPIVFILANNLFSIKWAAISAIASAVMIGVGRVIAKQTWYYAFGGLVGVVIASGFAYIAGNAANYYIPKIIGSLAFVIATSISLIIKKPLAAWVSHLSRGWNLKWFWRGDIRPAYTEVTIFWTVFLILKLLLQIVMFQKKNITGLFFVNTVLSMPANIIVLVSSYVYGIWRLRNLGGPGIEEFMEGKEAPWKGQTRGF